MKKCKVLFVCIHNSARSQMAEAWLKHFCPDTFAVQSAGMEPGQLNPWVVEVMQEAGLDISRQIPQAVSAVIQRGETMSYVITVCDETSAERCPVFPGGTQRLHWSFPDPSTLAGTREEKLARIREIRDQIKMKVQAWCAGVCPQVAAAQGKS